MNAEFHPAAEQELAAAMVVGELRGTGLGAELLSEAQRISELLCRSPSIGEAMDAQHRRFPLPRFPFALIYRINDEVLAQGRRNVVDEVAGGKRVAQFKR